MLPSKFSFFTLATLKGAYNNVLGSIILLYLQSLTECKCACNKQFSILAGGPPTQKLTKSQLTIMCKLAGPQHRS
ncbi:hypothetical protein CKX96_11800 [Staphylococcus argenteus]|nr:hypothetical protein CJ017_03380 [Staphylococcus argenteus]OAF02050.1 hypothetical protein AXJ26_01540 [Staphylococcus argenteus]OMH88316.1 hypothetical protein A4R30_11170 [Staphylococcus argenteus]OMH93424.1 hypothetical protein A4R31_00980 [Staphylococcus argenteus]OMI02707.1 hypothetical protein A4R33_04170 [Staphylococcus argenteus]